MSPFARFWPSWRTFREPRAHGASLNLIFATFAPQGIMHTTTDATQQNPPSGAQQEAAGLDGIVEQEDQSVEARDDYSTLQGGLQRFLQQVRGSITLSAATDPRIDPAMG